MEIGHKFIVTKKGKKKSIETMWTKNRQAENKEGVGGRQWAGQQTEQTKRTTYSHGEGRKRENGKKGNDGKHDESTK